MPMSTRNRMPVPVSQPKNATTARKNNPSQSRSVKNKPEEKLVPSHDSSEDDVPLAEIKAKQSKLATKAPAKIKGASASKTVRQKIAKVIPNDENERKRVDNDATFILTAKPDEESDSGLSNEVDQESGNDKSSESEKILDVPSKTITFPTKGKIQVRQFKVGKEFEYDEVHAVSEVVTTTKKGKKNPVSSDDVEITEVTSDFRSQDEEPEPANPPSKVKRGKRAVMKKNDAKEVPLDSVSDNNALEVAKKPTKGGRKPNKAPVEESEQTEVTSDNYELRVAPKPMKRGAKRVDPPVEDDSICAASDDNSPEFITKSVRRTKRKDIPTENSEPLEAVSDDDRSEVPQKPAKQGGKKQTKKVQNKKEELEAMESLPVLMNQLDLNQDDGLTKGRKAKGGARSKSKPSTKNFSKKKEIGSDPETTMSKYSSTESLKNITFRSGLVKSFSEDNLNALAGPLLVRSKREVALKSYTESTDKEVSKAAVKKTKASRKKAAK